jgi:hypothetical protein
MTQPPSSRIIKIANILGAAGLLPFFLCAALAILPWGYREVALLALLAYGACILSFLGAVHWGLVLAGNAGSDEAAGLRLALGTLPSLIAWVALILGITGQKQLGIAVILAGLLATVITEAACASKQLMPIAYFRLRVALSTLVALTLTIALVL